MRSLLITLSLLAVAAAGDEPLAPIRLQIGSIETIPEFTLADGISGRARGWIPAARTASGAKYSKLLRKFESEKDRASYGDFYDYGYYSGTSWAGHTDLPAGYWVYVDGSWHIFGASSQDAQVNGSQGWGPEQATGAPDTPQAGDYATAWASQSADGQAEWLELTYDQPCKALAIMIYESYNPGAVTRVTVFDADGAEHTVFEGRDPAAGSASGRGVAVLPVNVAFPTGKVKVYIDSPAVSGWNEIDAVGIIDDQGTTHWATGTTASSSYADLSSGKYVPATTVWPVELGGFAAPIER